MENLLIFFYILISISLILIILLQQGKGSDLGSAFGGGSSDSLFGPLGPSNFFSQITWALITVFFVLCLLLAYISKQELTLDIDEDVIEEVFEEPPVE